MAFTVGGAQKANEAVAPAATVPYKIFLAILLLLIEWAGTYKKRVLNWTLNPKPYKDQTL